MEVVIINRVFLSLLMSWVLLFAAGCSSSVKSVPRDPNITAIKTVLNHQFTGPDSEFINGLDDPQKLEQYYEKRYRSYFTDNMFDSFVSAYAYNYLLMAHSKRQVLKLDKVDVKTIDSKDHVYDFKAAVLYGKKGSEQKSADVTGTVNFNDKGKISGISFNGDTGLTKDLKD